MSSSVDAVLVLASCTDTALLCSRRCLDSALRLRSTSMSRSPGVSLVRSYLSLALLPFVRVTGCLVIPIGFVRRRRLVGSVGLARSCASIPRRQTCHSKRRILFGAGFSISSDGHIQGRYEYNKIYKGRLAHTIPLSRQLSVWYEIVDGRFYLPQRARGMMRARTSTCCVGGLVGLTNSAYSYESLARLASYP